MEFTEISKILSEKDGKASIHGWIHNKRSSGGILFLIIRDGTGLLQCTLKKDKFDKKFFEEIEKLPAESLVELHGMVKKDPRAPGGYELVVDVAKIEQKAEEKFPIEKKFQGPEYLMDNRHFWLRSEKMQNIIKIRSKFLLAAREWFVKNGFTEIQVPVIVGAAVEGGSTLFEVKYFGKKAYLTQSWQLYAEAAIASIGKCFTVAPSFRAEKSRTRRHLTEYTHMEAEEPWCDLEGTMKTQEQLLTYICHYLAENAVEELKHFGRESKELLAINPPFKRITYDEGIKILQNKGVKVKWGDDIDWRHEKVLSMQFDKPFFFTHFPKGIKAFYHKPDPAKPEVTLSADMLAPEGYGEVTGSGQRIHDYEELVKRINEEKLNVDSYKWYVDLRRYGMPPHAGFGLGVERVIAWLLRLKHIRDAVLFPRLINRVYP